MRSPQDLSHPELVALVKQLQRTLYLDVDDSRRPIWNPNKVWDGADVCDQLAQALVERDLVPTSVTFVDDKLGDL